MSKTPKPDMDRQFLEMDARGMTAEQIAEATGREARSVARRIRTLKGGSPKPMNYYSAADDEKIIHLVGTLNKPLSAVAAALGRTKGSVSHRIYQLRDERRLPPLKSAEEISAEKAKADGIAFLAALEASETAPANVSVKPSRHPVRMSAPLSLSCVGSPASLCTEN